MKIKFSREVPYVPTWNSNRDLPEAEQVKVLLKPMRVGDLLLVMDAMGRKPGEEAGDDKVDVSRLIQETGSILPKYAKISNLEDDNGPVTIEEMLNYGAYMPLAAELLMECARVSMPSESAEGNSSPQSA